MGREENKVVFQDTEKLCKTVDKLKNAIKKSVNEQKFIPESADFGVQNKEKYETAAQIKVTKKRSFEAASAYKGLKTCVHNFASATTPGGGVVKGSSAQEECLCRCSTLYFCLNTPQMWDNFYTPHREAEDPRHNADCIYTPGVLVIKTDTADPKLMPEADWSEVNVVTLAAPNLRLMPSNAMNASDSRKRVKMTDVELYETHVKRLTRLLDIAAAEGNEAVILGAFGCGAFENNPEIVARAAKDVVAKFLHAFKVIEFAVYCPPQDDTNYRVFSRQLTGLSGK